jgi:hypothetical protein
MGLFNRNACADTLCGRRASRVASTDGLHDRVVVLHVSFGADWEPFAAPMSLDGNDGNVYVTIVMLTVRESSSVMAPARSRNGLRAWMLQPRRR